MEETNFTMRIPMELKKKAEEKAKERGLTLSAYIRLMLFEKTSEK